MKKIISLFTFLALAPNTFAHAGEHAAEVSIWEHVMSEPYHIAPVIGFLIVAVVVSARKKLKKIKVEQKNHS